MQFTELEKQVLLKYDLIDENSHLIRVCLERPDEKPLGDGPKMEEDAIKRLLAADTTPNRRWTDWIFFHAAGGQRAKDASKRAFEQTKERFLDERVNGFSNPDTKEVYKPVPKEEADARWNTVEPRWRALLECADQDVVDHLGVFGYHRSWPGKDKVYLRVVQTVTKFLRLADKLAVMNAERREQSVELLSSDPNNYATLDDLTKAVSRIERYFVSKEAREDIQSVTLINDEFLQVICPLTYAASVRYGFDNWSFSSRATFDEVLENEHSFRDAWKQTTSRATLVFFCWKVPMPSWISRKENEFCRYELVNLALELPHNSADVDRNTLIFHDEENAVNMTYAQLCKMISDEPTRLPDPQDEEMPVKRGLNAYSTKEEAAVRRQAFDEALVAVLGWACVFDTARIKKDVFSSISSESTEIALS